MQPIALVSKSEDPARVTLSMSKGRRPREPLFPRVT